ncbi:unnamed protein product [Angiostrongylus costaricensis]|uniref:Reverse transcriptase domain-containing protein n=1 Tax=Angiostrongylus costaricensis TaxID=334426 RepID=A0A0R3PKG8_ANGCS|nr:unnamed protein product [Angiostrongylus costaricensis]
MGQRLAPTLAVAFMSKVEAPVIDLTPLLYCRYIDDCFVVCSTQQEMDKYFELLKEQSVYIKFTRGKPKESWLPFLNVQTSPSENGCNTKWYRKPNNKTIRTAASVCTDRDQREGSSKLACQMANSNGYETVASR